MTRAAMIPISTSSGLGEPFFVSAEHGVGEAALRDAILAKLGPLPADTGGEPDRRTSRFASVSSADPTSANPRSATG